MTTNEKRKPVHEIRLGLVKAAIWQNKGKKGVHYSVTFARLFKREADETWRFTSSFGEADLHRIRNIADQAYNWIHSQAQQAPVSGQEAVAQ